MWISYVDVRSLLHRGQNMKEQSAELFQVAKSLLLQCPAGTNKAGPFSPSKSPALAEMTDLQLRH